MKLIYKYKLLFNPKSNITGKISDMKLIKYIVELLEIIMI